MRQFILKFAVQSDFWPWWFAIFFILVNKICLYFSIMATLIEKIKCMYYAIFHVVKIEKVKVM